MNRIINFNIFVLLWFVACAIQYHFLKMEEPSYIMSYGYIVGASISYILELKDRLK